MRGQDINSFGFSRRRRFSKIELFIVLAMLGILSAAILGAGSNGGGCFNLRNGDGEKIGQVVKLSKEGFMSKTWEAQLIRGGISDGSGSFGTVPFDFTIEGDDLVAKVKEYMDNRTEVSIKYRIEGTYSPFRSGSSGRFLTEIEPLKKPDQAERGPTKK
jgi:hypothetical protein